MFHPYIYVLIMEYSSFLSSPKLGFSPRFSSASVGYCPDCDSCPDRYFCCGCSECLNS